MHTENTEPKDKYLPDALQFELVLQQTIELLGQKLEPAQVHEMGQVFRTLSWNFRDRAFQVYLLLNEKDEIKYARDISGIPDVTITLDASILHDSAYGRTTFGTAFVMGKLKVKGIPALKLNKFIPLLKPFLESYRQAWEAYHE